MSLKQTDFFGGEESTKVKREEFYKDAYPGLKLAERRLLDLLDIYRLQAEEDSDLQPVVYICGYKKSLYSALHNVYDAVGVRAVCAFSEDVFRLVNWLKTRTEIEIILEKDYYANPKPNGYRSYHIIVQVSVTPSESYFAELQIRTIANDFWAVLDHRLNYKKDIPHKDVIQEELKRCALEIVSVDASMQAIRDLLNEE